MRSKKIFFVSECILNQNIRADGVGNMSEDGLVREIIDLISASGFGISVVSCPELAYEGLKRNACNKEVYDNPVYRAHCARLAQEFVTRYKMYLADGYKVGGFICVNGSPSCAIDYCFRGQCANDKCVNNKCYESGIFIEEIQKKLQECDLELSFVGVRIKDMPTVLQKISAITEALGASTPAH